MIRRSTMSRHVPQHFRELSDDEWTSILVRSTEERTIDGLEFPSFPPASLQERWEVSSYGKTLHEAAAFYTFVKNASTRLGMSISYDSKLLDFGCGWGRFLRFFW